MEYSAVLWLIANVIHFLLEFLFYFPHNFCSLSSQPRAAVYRGHLSVICGRKNKHGNKNNNCTVAARDGFKMTCHACVTQNTTRPQKTMTKKSVKQKDGNVCFYVDVRDV